MELAESLDLLGLEHDCTTDDVKRAFRDLSRAYHSDRYDGRDADEKFRNIHSAYRTVLEYTRSRIDRKEVVLSELKTEDQVYEQWMSRFHDELDLGNYESAITAIDKVVDLRPDDGHALLEKFKLLLDMEYSRGLPAEKNNEGIKSIIATADTLLEKLPSNDNKNRAYVYNEVGVMHEIAGDAKKALTYYSKSHKEYRGQPAYMLNFATTLNTVGMAEGSVNVFNIMIEEFPQQALRYLEDLCDDNPTDAFYASLYARVLKERGYEYIARKWRKKAMELNRKYGGTLVLD